MSLLRDKILARMYLHLLNTPSEWEMNHHQLFTMLQRRVGDAQIAIDHLTDTLFQAAVQELLDLHYLEKTNSHGTIYLHLTEKGKAKARAWLNTNLGTQQAPRPRVRAVSAPVSGGQEMGGIGCGVVLVIAAVIAAGFIIYVLKDPALKPALFCTSIEYKKNVRIVTEREEDWRKEAGFSASAISNLSPNTELQIVDGPKSMDGVCWWKVQMHVPQSNGAWQAEGWLPEHNKAGQPVFKKRQ